MFDFTCCFTLNSINDSFGVSKLWSDGKILALDFVSKWSSENGGSEVIASTSFWMSFDKTGVVFLLGLIHKILWMLIISWLVHPVWIKSIWSGVTRASSLFRVSCHILHLGLQWLHLHITCTFLLVWHVYHQSWNVGLWLCWQGWFHKILQVWLWFFWQVKFVLHKMVSKLLYRYGDASKSLQLFVLQ